MSIVQIGARLVRQFGEGKNLRKVVTETLNGKTFTKVLDSNGNTILDRAKKIDRYEVGNKKVSTITKVSQKPESPRTKQVTDRVYDGESRLLLGKRVTNFRADINKKENCYGFVKRSTTKSHILNDIGIKKDFNGDGIAESRTIVIDGFYPVRSLHHNNKGLPMPKGGNPGYFEDMSLAEMRRWNVLNNPDKPYAPAEFRLGYLDKQDEVLGTIHDLDKFF